MEVKNLRTGRVLEISVNGKVRDWTKEHTMQDEAKPEVWLNIKSRVRFDSLKLNKLKNSPIRIIDPTNYRRETKASWSFGR